ncbi:M50 family metallopeptidase [Vibrio makurazakiensis]|uniref:hypothetical protein n=1 Tax=Vibrio makurazakiensis TaxID=2910250 RepID=UPI003D0BFFF1
MSILITFVCLIVPVALVIGLHNLIAHLVMPRVYRSTVSRSIYYGSAFFGTPIHEISHAIMALLFGHKVEKICLFQSGKDGRLGYVKHSWNTRSIYQNTGLFFIAIAPLFGAGLVLVTAYFSLDLTINGLSFISQSDTPIDVLGSFLTNGNVLIRGIFANSQSLLVFLGLSLVCFHCVPSRSDFKNAIKGSLVALLVISAVLFGLGFFKLQQGLSFIFGVWSFSITITMIVLFSSLLWWLVLGVTALLFNKRMS